MQTAGSARDRPFRFRSPSLTVLLPVLSARLDLSSFGTRKIEAASAIACRSS
jgi:hypothetical protein